MPNSKLRVIAHNVSTIAQPKDSVAPASCTGEPASPVGAEENLRLIKAFSCVDDVRRRAWLLELVEHFAGLGDSAKH
jgi:hypothetical protein